ncbi:MAG: Serine/threonine-protein kinase PknD [Phycisphaerae bacterium]|nr:Serine/threonine-protein kinase PknD [Phycisphaerae bacterium]
MIGMNTERHTMVPGTPEQRLGNYQLEELIGSGSYGQVWRARHLYLNRPAAIKIPTDAEYVRQLRHEGVLLYGLQHPNIVALYDFDPFADPPYLIMEYIDGPNLRTLLQQHRQGLPLPIALTILDGLLRALHAAHQNKIVHRDLKPENILLNIGSASLATLRAKDIRISDFGLGVISGLTTQTLLQSGSLRTDGDQSLSGTIAYLSPEQRDGLTVDSRSDLFSVGIIWFEMLTGIRPQGHDWPSDLVKNLPPLADKLFERSYTRRETRFTDSSEILNLIHEWISARGEATDSQTELDLVDTELPPLIGSCPRCTQAIRVGDLYCVQCGLNVNEHTQRCEVCGRWALGNDPYCIYCGQQLIKAEKA